MNRVFVVQHEHEAANGCDEVKFIGVYATQEEADKAIERVRLKPGFINHPKGFSVNAYEVGQDHWMDGFFTDH